MLEKQVKEQKVTQLEQLVFEGQRLKGSKDKLKTECDRDE